MLVTVGYVHPLHHFRHAFSPILRGHFHIEERQLYVLNHIEFIYQIEALENDSDASFPQIGAFILLQLADVFPVEEISPLRGYSEGLTSRNPTGP